MTQLSLVFILFCALCRNFSEVLGEDKNRVVDSAENAIVEITTRKLVPTTKNVPKETPSTTVKPVDLLMCPGKEINRPLFSLPCKQDQDCGFLGKGVLCCRNRCLKGVFPPKPEPRHEPMFFGLVDRQCPKDPIPEIFQVKDCLTDAECTPRICCPENLPGGGYVSYCRTAVPIWDKVPVARAFIEPVKSLMSYMQCTPPPPPLLDLFPKPCNNPLDCFPNLCCQEKGQKFCRPPKRSLLALVAGIGQRIVPSDAARKFIERIS